MNIQKFTQKSMEAVEGCQKLAYEYGHQEIEQEHLLYSLLTIEDSLIYKLIEKWKSMRPISRTGWSRHYRSARRYRAVSSVWERI